MTDNIRNTMLSPGWKEIIEKASRRIEKNMKACVASRDETEALKWHRAGWAAHDALQEFLIELEGDE